MRAEDGIRKDSEATMRQYPVYTEKCTQAGEIVSQEPRGTLACNLTWVRL